MSLNLTGETFGRWLVVYKFGVNKYGNVLWHCRCVCGKSKVIAASSLTTGKSKSCGCLQKDVTIITHTKHGHAVGQSKTSEYHAWQSMKHRCYNSNNNRYKDYGERGIRVCDRWLDSFDNFINDMGKKPSPNFSLDRIRVNEDYSPSNCRWGSDETQARNRRTNVWIEYNGQKMILADWAKKLNVHQSTLQGHLRRGKSFADAVGFLIKKRAI